MPVGIDAMVVIWSLRLAHERRKTKSLPVQMVRRSRILLEKLRSEGEMVFLSNLAAAEILAGVNPLKHGKLFGVLQEKFMLVPFDAVATQTAARIAYDFAAKQPKLPKDDKPRHCLKTDILIVASAKAAGAATFYSNDRQCRTLAETAGMKAFDLPTHSESLLDELMLDEELAEENGGEEN